jgi:hypothetical protein
MLSIKKIYLNLDFINEIPNIKYIFPLLKSSKNNNKKIYIVPSQYDLEKGFSRLSINI